MHKGRCGMKQERLLMGAVLAVWLIGAGASGTAPLTLPTTGSAPLRIVCLGDSITDGHTYPLLVQQALAEAGKPVPVMINAGVGGDGVVGMCNRLERDVLSFQPDLVIVSAGLNDLSMSPQEYRGNLDALLDPLAKARIRVLLLTLTTLAKQHAGIQPRIDAFNAILRTEAKERGLLLGEVAGVMKAAAGTGATLNEADGCHLSFEGFRQMTRGVLDGMGYADVPVPTAAKLSVIPGVIRDWRMRLINEETGLTEQAVATLAPDETWKTLSLPEDQRAPNWFMDQERQRGVAVALDRVLGPARVYQGMAVVESESNRDVYVNTGASLRSVWVNGKKLPMATGPVGWRPGGNRIPAKLKAGRNVIVIEAGNAFFLSITDDRYW